MIALLLVGLAVAVAETPPPVDPAEVIAEDIYEIIVRGEDRLGEARARITGALEAQGWEALDHRRDGEIVFRPPYRWLGRAHLSRDGVFRFGRPVLKAGETRLPDAPYTFDAAVGHAAPPAPAAATKLWLLPSRDVRMGPEAAALAAIREPLAAYNEALREVRFDDALARLPERLDRLWNDGLGFNGGEPLATPEARRRAVLDFWATRAGTPEGDAISATIEDWLAATVQPSPHPVTEAERRSAEARRNDGRRLAL